MEFILQIKNSAGIIVAQTYISGGTPGEVLEDAAEQIEAQQQGDSDWAEGLEEEF